MPDELEPTKNTSQPLPHDGMQGAETIRSNVTISTGKVQAVIEKAGDRIGRYKLLQQIGEGGGVVVYMAEQSEPVRRRVALKVIKLGMDTRQVVARFEAERQALAMMDHANIARVFDAGATETGRPYFVMELVRGTKITEFCDQQKLSTRERLGLFIQVCAAIQHAHQKGIIHRDLKPSNVLVTMIDGVAVPKVIDFGIAKATNQQPLTDKTLFTAFEQFIGTPAYMSPEQAEMSGVDIDTRSDIYSLGVLLYELLTGQPPFDSAALVRSGLDGIRRTLREQEPPRPSTRLGALVRADLTTVAHARHTEAPKLVHLVRGDLDWVVMKCLEKDRARRYETANGLVMDLQRHLANEPITARPPSTGYRLKKWVRRNRLAFAAGASIAGVLVAATAISTWQAVRAIRAEAHATERAAAEVAARTAEAAQRLRAETGEARAIAAEAEATKKTAAETAARGDAEAVTAFLTTVFQSPDPARDGRTITVAETLDRAAKKLDTDFASQPDRRAKLQAVLGSTYRALGLPREAVPLLENVRDHCLTRLGPEHPDTLSAMHELASAYADAGRHEEARKLQEQVLDLRRKVSGPEHPDTLAAMNNLANSYSVAGRRDEALKLREQVLELRLQILGPEHPSTLSAMNNLAIFYSDTGRSEEALKLREQVLELYRKVLGIEHRSTLAAMTHLANSYSAAGRREEALKLREQVLEPSRKVNGPDDPSTLLAMYNLANSYSVLGRLEEALKLREQVLPLRRKVLGDEHPDTLATMTNLAISFRLAGRVQEATELQEKSLAIKRRVLPPGHPFLAAAIGNLAACYEGVGRREEAEALRQDLATMNEKTPAPVPGK